MARIIKTTLFSVAALSASAGLATAHPGHGAAGLASGFLHPLSGADHVMAMLAVGLFAARLGGRALWAVPTAFLSMMAAGGALGFMGVGLPGVELAIAASVIVLGAAALVKVRMPVLTAAAVAGFFALFHGFAHGSEMPLTATGLSYGAGFLSATGLLIAMGLALGLRLAGRQAARSA